MRLAGAAQVDCGMNDFGASGLVHTARVLTRHVGRQHHDAAGYDEPTGQPAPSGGVG